MIQILDEGINGFTRALISFVEVCSLDNNITSCFKVTTEGCFDLFFFVPMVQKKCAWLLLDQFVLKSWDDPLALKNCQSHFGHTSAWFRLFAHSNLFGSGRGFPGCSRLSTIERIFSWIYHFVLWHVTGLAPLRPCSIWKRNCWLDWENKVYSSWCLNTTQGSSMQLNGNSITQQAPPSYPSQFQRE